MTPAERRVLKTGRAWIRILDDIDQAIRTGNQVWDAMHQLQAKTEAAHLVALRALDQPTGPGPDPVLSELGSLARWRDPIRDQDRVQTRNQVVFPWLLAGNPVWLGLLSGPGLEVDCPGYRRQPLRLRDESDANEHRVGLEEVVWTDWQAEVILWGFAFFADEAGGEPLCPPEAFVRTGMSTKGLDIRVSWL